MTSTQQSLSSPQAYPKWDELIAKLPAKWRSALIGSSASLVKIQDKGYLVDINGFDRDKLEAAFCKDGFREQLSKIIVPWAFNHPAGKPRQCWGICLGGNVMEETKELRAIGATFYNIWFDKKWGSTRRDDVQEQLNI